MKMSSHRKGIEEVLQNSEVKTRQPHIQHTFHRISFSYYVKVAERKDALLEIEQTSRSPGHEDLVRQHFSVQWKISLIRHFQNIRRILKN